MFVPSFGERSHPAPDNNRSAESVWTLDIAELLYYMNWLLGGVQPLIAKEAWNDGLTHQFEWWDGVRLESLDT